MIRNPRLAELRSSWIDLGIGHLFYKVHHIATDKFSGVHESLDVFIKYCDSREIREENSQTVTRALHVARRMKVGDDFSKAVEQAWQKYPIVTR